MERRVILIRGIVQGVGFRPFVYNLAAAVEFDADAARRSIQAVRPGMEVFEVSAKTGEGLGAWLHFLQARRAERLPAASS